MRLLVGRTNGDCREDANRLTFDDVPADAEIVPWGEILLQDLSYEIRHDMNGFYVCTAEEGKFEDAGNPSVGFDGRRHYAEYSDALAAFEAEGALLP